ncbi:hypothetical protein ALC62_08166 [Cyphomyrmex costatus]|uniref:Uncharacterized protein n=1 Tax=Cyphomyrmex costatus TaxID=456900 RepID=A0A195CJN3_9HYME|nr:hypothetical protein ALC62_08166 [Cyphomyrmex costatus]
MLLFLFASPFNTILPTASSCIQKDSSRARARVNNYNQITTNKLFLCLTIFLFSTNAIRYNRFLHTLTRKYFYARLLPFTSDIRIQTSYSITTSIIKSPSS